ncbi:MAG TPA: hypothetical protein VH601_17485 [Bryobacteraceae bacterium]|jgi:hypothetical protein
MTLEITETELWERLEVEIEGRQVVLISYRIGKSYLVQIEACDSGELIARATGKTLFETQIEALNTAATRLGSTVRNLELTVGG